MRDVPACMPIGRLVYWVRRYSMPANMPDIMPEPKGLEPFFLSTARVFMGYFCFSRKP